MEIIETMNAKCLTALHSASNYKESLPNWKILLGKGANILPGLRIAPLLCQGK
jgi:hypothetical protein